MSGDRKRRRIKADLPEFDMDRLLRDAEAALVEKEVDEVVKEMFPEIYDDPDRPPRWHSRPRRRRRED